MNILNADIAADPVDEYRFHLGDQADWVAELPEHMRPGLVRYVLYGIIPGRFLRAVMANEWELAKRKADEINAKVLPAYMDLLAFGCPEGCHGNPEKVRAWCEGGGWIGRSPI